MNLILWRHAEAEYGPPDLQRRLTEKGCKQAQQAAGWLQAHLPDDYEVWASEAARSSQTAAYLKRPLRIMSEFNPEADVRAMPALLASLDEKATVVITGHQPWLGQWCAFLLNGHWQSEVYWSVKKGAFWWFCLQSSAGLQQAKLLASLSPAMLSEQESRRG